MSVQTAVITILEANSTVTTLLGTRIYPGILPVAPTLPAMRFNKVAGSGGTTTGPDLVMSRLQFDIYAYTSLESEAAAKAVYNALRRWSGTSDGLNISDITLDYMQTIFEPTTNVYRSIMDFKIYSEGM
jgi:hypothetical protein